MPEKNRATMPLMPATSATCRRTGEIVGNRTGQATGGLPLRPTGKAMQALQGHLSRHAQRPQLLPHAATPFLKPPSHTHTHTHQVSEVRPHHHHRNLVGGGVKGGGGACERVAAHAGLMLNPQNVRGSAEARRWGCVGPPRLPGSAAHSSPAGQAPCWSRDGRRGARARSALPLRPCT
jgi:hypothetical protein